MSFDKCIHLCSLNLYQNYVKSSIKTIEHYGLSIPESYLIIISCSLCFLHAFHYGSLSSGYS